MEQIPLVLRTLVGTCALIFTARILGGLCAKFKVPEVVGMILSGVILGPYALGGIIPLFGHPLIELNDIFLAFAQIGGLVVLFAAGFEFTFTDFRAVGVPSFTIAAIGVIASFFLGYGFGIILGFDWQSAMITGAALTSTSVAITSNTLKELNLSKSDEAKLIINASVIDSVVALAVLAIATSIIYLGVMPSIIDVAVMIAKSIALWLMMLVTTAYVLPRLIDITILWRARGTVEAAATTACFGCAFLAAAIGLSPIVGAFAAGMAIASSKAIPQIKEYTEKLELIFGPIFFAVMGAYLSPAAMGSMSPFVFFIVFAVAVFGKLVCALPAAYFLHDVDKALRVAIGMIPGGEVGLIILGLALASGVIAESLYATLLITIVATAVIAPLMLVKTFKKTLST